VRDTTALVVIQVSQRTDGADVAEAIVSGRRYSAISRNGAAMALARQLVAAGIGDGPWEARGADEQRRFFGPSLHGLSRLTITDNDHDGLRIRRFTPRVLPVGDTEDGALGAGSTAQPKARRPDCTNAGTGLANITS
jgi:hypothetical protein